MNEAWIMYQEKQTRLFDLVKRAIKEKDFEVANEFRKEIMLNELQFLANQDSGFEFKTVLEIIGVTDCEASKEIDGLLVEMENELKSPTLPYERCNRNNLCACSYATIAKRDENGRLIPKK